MAHAVYACVVMSEFVQNMYAFSETSDNSVSAGMWNNTKLPEYFPRGLLLSQ